MSLITLTTIAKVLKASGVSADDILSEAGLTREEALAALASELGIEAPAAPEAAVEVTPEEVAALKAATGVLNRILS